MKVPARSHLHPAVVVTESPIHGLGLFAGEPIAPGVLVARLGGSVTDDAGLAALEPPYSSIALGPGRHLVIDPADPIRYGNHSCDPNLWMSGAFDVTVRRAIKAGEELTIDYATQTGPEDWEMPCRCGSPQCRGRVTGGDWRVPSLRAAYREHWIPLLLDKIRRAPS